MGDRHIVAEDALPVRRAVEQRHPRRVQLKQYRIKLVFVEQLEKIAPDGAK